MNTHVKVRPMLRGHFHQAMFFVALGACLPLIFRCHSFEQRLSIIIYTVCALSMFGISSLYHRVTWTMPQRAAWKKFDHSGIFLMIAGTFTPVALLGLSTESGHTLLLMVWSFAALGIILSFFFVNLPKMVNSSIYLVMGYLILPYLGEVKNSLGTLNLWLIIAGGIVYSVGAIVYGLKRPVLNPIIFSYHELFHLLVNVGAVLHFIVVSSLI
ncbi:MAG: hemolysin III family protein [Bacteriovoracaceae bacterium]|nr:hemolysin III family protein [Bacteriovoracaceae bacterium]